MHRDTRRSNKAGIQSLSQSSQVVGASGTPIVWVSYREKYGSIRFFFVYNLIIDLISYLCDLIRTLPSPFL